MAIGPDQSGSSRVHRLHRQALLPEFGPASIDKVAAAHVMIIGMGALGCPAADLLARAGIGTLSLVDRDIVELTNLQRQTLYDERDAAEAMPKAEAAARRLRSVNSIIRIHAMVEDFSPSEAEHMVTPHPRPTVLLDCTDNFETRYLINDVAVKLGTPLVYGGAVGTSGMTMTILPRAAANAPESAWTAGPCLRCIFPDPPAPGSAATCDTAGVLGPLASMVAARQATEALKIVLGRFDRADPALDSFDPWINVRQRLNVRTATRRADCPCCGQRRFDFLGDAAIATEPRVLCGRNSVQITPGRSRTPASRHASGNGCTTGSETSGIAAPRGSVNSLDLATLFTRLAALGTFTRSEHTLRGVLREDGRELTIFADGRAIIGGTTDPAQARSIYARYIGV